MSEEEIVAQRAHRHHSLVWGHAGMCHNMPMFEDVKIKLETDKATYENKE